MEILPFLMKNVIIESLLYFNKIIKDSQQNLVIPTFGIIVHSIVDLFLI